jgi:hypothetical protein
VALGPVEKQLCHVEQRVRPPRLFDRLDHRRERLLVRQECDFNGEGRNGRGLCRRSGRAWATITLAFLETAGRFRTTRAAVAVKVAVAIPVARLAGMMLEGLGRGLRPTGSDVQLVERQRGRWLFFGIHERRQYKGSIDGNQPRQ